jgi:hypothetical protein
VTLWQHRRQRLGRVVLAVALAATAGWSFVLLSRSPNWLPWLRPVVLAVGLTAAVVMAVTPALRAKVAVVVAVAGLGAALAGPAAYALDTVATSHSGAIPSAGPAVSGGMGGGPGGFGAGSPLGRGQLGGRPSGAGPLGAGRFGAGPSGVTGGVTGGSTGGRPTLPTNGSGSFPSRGGSGRPGTFGTTAPAGGQGAGGGLLNASTPGKKLVSLLEARAGSYRWVAATVNSNSAAGYQLATDDPVMAIGGFNGTDPAPTLAQFESYVRDGAIHYFIAGGGQGGGLGGGGTTSAASRITAWVESHYTATTVDGVTLYDLTTAKTS